MERQCWWQTISLIITMLGIGAFIWLNVPTNNDIRDLKNEIQNLKNELKKYPTREEMDARFDKLEVLFKTGFSNLENVTTIYRDEVKDMKDNLQAHTQNYDVHVVKQSRR